jgi:hypothetical protein
MAEREEVLDKAKSNGPANYPSPPNANLPDFNNQLPQVSRIETNIFEILYSSNGLPGPDYSFDAPNSPLNTMSPETIQTEHFSGVYYYRDRIDSMCSSNAGNSPNGYEPPRHSGLFLSSLRNDSICSSDAGSTRFTSEMESMQISEMGNGHDLFDIYRHEYLSGANSNNSTGSNRSSRIFTPPIQQEVSLMNPISFLRRSRHSRNGSASSSRAGSPYGSRRDLFEVAAIGSPKNGSLRGSVCGTPPQSGSVTDLLHLNFMCDKCGVSFKRYVLGMNLQEGPMI